ncbi:uncharacterized protein PFL1_05913 [Pseudozyma flocculosa PF-1]|uniref:Amine oxidase n=2 Tax=Pseudozyma flocculosa TaxID=84751 RepID=A0A5C3F1S3_9BASI|nr:uncharacterized protein PFL1_05913 [Pseudozyma flocculosa PF-1]EPQ26592.1 hypothetical protein PFL1_05913 [Pseudozyma flocculosa PF-1]SPO38414.1 related to peroxisomal amine oxidase (copper-containing) [Pseudozyma flocculosa]
MDAQPLAHKSTTRLAAGPYHGHPLDPPTAQEITATTSTFRVWLAEHGVKAFKIVTVLLKEPPKASVIAAVGWPGGYPAVPNPPALERVMEVHAIDVVKGEAYEALVRLDGPEPQVKDVRKLDKGVQPSITPEELCLAEKKIRKDERVVKLAAEVGIEPEQIFADGWTIGWDKRFGDRRVQQCLLYARLNEHDNLYAHPLDFQPILDCNSDGGVIAIDFPQHRNTPDGKLSSGTTAPPESISFEAPASRQRIPPPLEPFEYLPDLSKQEMRTDLKPIHVTQPQGVSFKRSGNVLEWSNYKLHVGFSPREGIVLSTISYMDADRPGASIAQPEERPIIYKMTLGDMVVPYGEPAWPHYRKFAFDVSEYSIGYLANSLSLGCDCLGSIEYMDGIVAKHDGSAEVIKNAICIHEEDTGLLWKHTDYREGGRAHAVRGRKLVISMICTVANYEYGIYWNLHTDGNIECEIKLTGILNLYVLGQGERPAGFGTEVMPRVNAHYHQHLFSLYVDPHIDGPNNSVVEQSIEALPEPTGSNENFAGNGFTAKKRVLRTSKEAVRDACASEERSWTFINPSQHHYASGQPVGYKVVCPNLPPMYAKQDSFVARRAPFAKHHFWTIPYAEGRRYPAGKYVPQTPDAPDDSLQNWANEDGNIADTDLVSFITFGTTHIPRPEDAPVMPAETVRCILKPVGFFRQNPALTIPSTQDAKSVAAQAAASAGSDDCCQKGRL